MTDPGKARYVALSDNDQDPISCGSIFYRQSSHVEVAVIEVGVR